MLPASYKLIHITYHNCVMRGQRKLNILYAEYLNNYHTTVLALIIGLLIS